jgi:hypothetical protein
MSLESLVVYKTTGVYFNLAFISNCDFSGICSGSVTTIFITGSIESVYSLNPSFHEFYTVSNEM